jgi:late competence protein required for DNA uptake (superfamily II DNA/RNA helicase)
LEKLLAAEGEVNVMKQELIDLQPNLIETGEILMQRTHPLHCCNHCCTTATHHSWLLSCLYLACQFTMVTAAARLCVLHLVPPQALGIERCV